MEVYTYLFRLNVLTCRVVCQSSGCHRKRCSIVNIQWKVTCKKYLRVSRVFITSLHTIVTLGLVHNIHIALDHTITAVLGLKRWSAGPSWVPQKSNNYQISCLFRHYVGPIYSACRWPYSIPHYYSNAFPSMQCTLATRYATSRAGSHSKTLNRSLTSGSAVSHICDRGLDVLLLQSQPLINCHSRGNSTWWRTFRDLPPAAATCRHSSQPLCSSIFTQAAPLYLTLWASTSDEPLKPE